MAGNPCNIIPDQEIVLEGGAKLVPAPEAADAGKVLGVVNASGDIGWVVDQSGTLVQQQANWTESDNQSVSFIQNKPDLSVYATTGAMNTALAGKQDTINDLSDIRAGAALGATAAQPSDLPSSDELVPSATSGDSGKVLTVDNQGNPTWVTPAGTAEFSWSTVTKSDVETALTAGKSVVINYATGNEFIQCYYTKSITTNEGTEYTFVSQALRGTLNSTNQNANVVKLVISGTGTKTQTTVPVSVKLVSNGSITIANGSNADEISISTNAVPASTSADANKVLTVDSNGAAGWQNLPAPSVDEVPDVTSSDDGKVLKASYSGGQGSYAWGTDSDTTYTAGNMIAINANNSNAIGVSTTAGITDIQVVNALPASPVATVLYMIPEA